jgi:hypothetical protein
MECLQCQTGYPVDIVEGARYCGFCGAGVCEIWIGFEVGGHPCISVDDFSPVYGDDEDDQSDKAIILNIRAENRGMKPAGIKTLEIKGIF